MSTVVDEVLIISRRERGAVAFLGYALCTGEIDLAGKLPINHIDDLRKMYVEAFWGGNFDHFGLNEDGSKK